MIRPRHHLNGSKPILEILEERCAPAAGFRSYDGTGNNFGHFDWGSVDSQLFRIAPGAYGDSISTPAGDSRPGAREISNAVMAETEELLNERLMSDFVYVFGQFLDHDLSLTENAAPAVPFDVAVPSGDPFFDPAGTGTQVIRLKRSAFDPTTGTGVGNPRQQISVVSAWLDASQIYGSDATRADALRTFVGGRLKTSPGDLLPFNTMGLSNQIPFGADPTQFFAAGDIRANENIELTAMHTLFLREHNRVADQIAAANPGLLDEDIYQRARQWIGAELQVITYQEFLPALLGPHAPGPYTGYQPTVNPSIANEFSTAAFRVGHTFLGDDVELLDNNGHEIAEEIPLSDAFFHPALVQEHGIEPILKYLSADKAREGDTILVGGVRNFLFGPPGAGGLDLGALDVQRARDHGLADYNTTREAYGLPRIQTFAQITSDTDLQLMLQSLYGTVDNIDVFVGGLAEDRAAGASVGPLFARIIAEQFQRLRDGDNFWYERIYSGSDLAELQQTTLASLIRLNTTITNIQDAAFFFEVSVHGRVVLGQNPNGLFDAGATVQLLDEGGEVIATTQTDSDGAYSFVGLIDAPGAYRARLLPGPRWTSTDPIEIDVTRGQIFTDTDFGVLPAQDLLYDSPTCIADLNADGIDDVIAGVTNNGGDSLVQTIDGRTGQVIVGPLGSFIAYLGYRSTLSVATGDVTGDGIPDIMTGADSLGVAAHVKVFNGADGSLVHSFLAFDPRFLGGVRVAAGDVNGDGVTDIIVAAGPGAAPHVKVFDGRTLQELASFFAYDARFSGGVFVAAGDVNGDGRDDIITGPGAGGAPVVRAFSGLDQAVLSSFLAYDVAFLGGVRVAAGDVNGDGLSDIFTGAGNGARPHVRVFDVANENELDSFFASDATAGIIGG